MIDRLPPVKGIYEENAPLAPLTTLKIGGPADVLFTPQDMDDFVTFLQTCPKDIPLTLLGEGSNVMVYDGGIRGVVVRLGKNVNNVEVSGHEIYAEAGATSGKVARAAREAGLTGAEFLCGIPGSIGGALMMNAGAYGAETVDILSAVDVVTDTGARKTCTPDDIGFSYRKSKLPKGWFYVGARFTLKPGDKEEIRQKMRQINKDRTTAQPIGMPSSGSWFKNVVQEDGSVKNAWRIVDEAGCRGWQVGQAQVSEKHSNFFVNLGGASAADLDALSNKVEAHIQKTLGVTMQREVRPLGEKKDV